MKKKIVALCLAVCLAAVAIIGGTLAYFTDTDEATNTFTAGGVAIDLIEQERGENGLQDFTQDKVLLPIVGSAQGEKDGYGQPVAANYVDKMITIKNTSKSDAWVRAYFAIPSALDDGFEESFNASMNILHFNFGNKIVNGEVVTTYNKEWLWGSVAKPEHSGWNYFETTIGGVAYNVYFADYYQKLAVGATTEQFVSGVYLDKNVDITDDGKYTITRNGVASVIEGFDGSAKCPVFVVAVQAKGFDNAAEAVTAAFGADFNPWAE